ncbi:unnamed protein product [Allacma fusca]|uniref:Uncharacterized protein n=1 Tax=Allacma fusca TaxID=39272 RepID=A0A8J2NS41_9HEXA|nr:unnamed protein product [Allacma fusca]
MGDAAVASAIQPIPAGAFEDAGPDSYDYDNDSFIPAIGNLSHCPVHNRTKLHYDPDIEGVKYVTYGVLMPAICALGIVGNVLNLIVLNQPNMKGTAYVYMRVHQHVQLEEPTEKSFFFPEKIPEPFLILNSAAASSANENFQPLSFPSDESPLRFIHSVQECTLKIGPDGPEVVPFEVSQPGLNRKKELQKREAMEVSTSSPSPSSNNQAAVAFSRCPSSLYKALQDSH